MEQVAKCDWCSLAFVTEVCLCAGEADGECSGSDRRPAV